MHRPSADDRALGAHAIVKLDFLGQAVFDSELAASNVRITKPDLMNVRVRSTAYNHGYAEVTLRERNFSDRIQGNTQVALG